jgi:integrase
MGDRWRNGRIAGHTRLHRQTIVHRNSRKLVVIDRVELEGCSEPGISRTHGIRVRHLDLIRRRARIEENAVMVNNTVVIGTPKSHKHRSVPIPPFVLGILALRAQTRGPDDYVVGDGTDPLRLPNSQDGWFAGAVRRAQKIDAKLPHVTRTACATPRHPSP